MTNTAEPHHIPRMLRSVRAPIFILAGSCMLFICAACRQRGTPAADPAPAAFSIMTYNLGRYNLDDRTGDGQRAEPKPPDERKAVIAIITAESPDVLAVQEIGNPAVFEEFRYALREAGLAYPHVEYLQRGQSELNLAVLSRFPIVRTEHHLDDRYSMGAAELPVLRGFLETDIQVNSNYSFRLIVAHLKSKVFHPLGQTEMRRNEARLLNKHVRRSLKEDPSINLLVLGDMNDNPRSAALREIMGGKQKVLVDLRPEDHQGDAWTYFNAELDEYARTDYALASPGMQSEHIPERSRVVRHPLKQLASDHSPIHVFFVAEERRETGF